MAHPVSGRSAQIKAGGGSDAKNDASAQTNPSAQPLPYSQDFGTASFSSLPAGWAIWNGVNGNSVSTQALAEASTPSGNGEPSARWLFLVFSRGQEGRKGFHHVRINHSKLFADRKNHINGIENFSLYKLASCKKILFCTRKCDLFCKNVSLYNQSTPQAHFDGFHRTRTGDFHCDRLARFE